MDMGNYLSTTKVLQWIERTMHLSLNGLRKEDERYYIDVDMGNDVFTRIYVSHIYSYLFLLLIKYML